MPKKAKTSWRRYAPYIVAGIILLAVAAAWGPIKKRYFDTLPVQNQPVLAQVDPICRFVERLGLRCLASPSAETLMGPGRYVRYAPSASDTKVPPLGSGSLFESVCIVDGVEPGKAIQELTDLLTKQQNTNHVPFDEVTYKLDRAFQAGASLPIPKLSNLELKAGPKLTEVQEISIKAPSAWVKVIDENRFIDILSRAAIKDTCIDQVIKQGYSVVSKAAIAQDYVITVKDKAGQEFALSAAVAKGQVEMSGGGTSSASIDEFVKKSSALPVVLGVDFFDTAFLTRNRAMLVTPILETRALTSVEATARERGSIVWRTENVAPLGQQAVLAQRGGGQSNVCGGGVPSVVDLRSSLELAPRPAESAEQLFQLRTTGFMSGSRFTPGSIVTGCAGSEIGDVQASVRVDAQVRTLVRSASAKAIHISLDRIDDAEVTVRDWTDKDLSASSSTGSDRTFALAGAGLYTIRVRGRRTVSASGPENRQVNEEGTFRVSVQ
jgi:hypothetical protein